MNKWIVIPISLIASLVGFVIGFYGTIIVSFAIGSSGERGIGVALDGILMPVTALAIGGLLAGLLSGIVGTRDARGTALVVGVAWTVGLLALVLILMGTPEFETTFFAGAAMGFANTAVIAMHQSAR